jgi:hypothetical protein
MLHDSDKSASNTSSLLEQVRDRNDVAQGGDGCQETTGWRAFMSPPLRIARLGQR